MDNQWLNSNTFHNVANVLIAASAGFEVFLITTGCTSAGTGPLECSHSWISPAWAPALVVLLSVSKIAVNMTRDGIGGLTKVQPPVSDTTKQVTVAAPDGATVKVQRPAPGKKN